MKTTIFKNITQTTEGTIIDINKVLEYIKDGRWLFQINNYRGLIKSVGKKSDSAKAAKKALPYFTVSGTFSKRSDEGLIDHSGFVAIDIDSLEPEQIKQTKTKLEKDLYSYSVFYSCSGNGLCVIVKIDPETHYETFENLAIYYSQNFNIEIDYLADVSRARFISYDPNLYLNKDSKQFDLAYELKEETVYDFHTTNQDTEKNLLKAVEMVEREKTYADGGKHNYMLDLAKVANKFGVDLSTFQGFVRASYPDWYKSPTNAIEHTYRKRINEHGIFQQTTSTAKIKESYEQLSEEELINKFAAFEADWSKPVDKPTPLVSVKGEIICTAGNLTVITGQSKTGKSGVSNGIVAGTLARKGIKCDTLGFDVEANLDRKLVLTIDTEQSRYNWDKNFRNVVERAYLSDSPEWFKSLHLKSLSVKEKLQTTWEALKYYSNKFGGVHFIQVDGIGDYVNDANDQTESSLMVHEFEKMAEEFDCPLITVLHTNYGSEKQRGALGSIIRRKVESSIMIKKENGISTVTYDLLRNAFEVPSIEFGYDKMKGYHTFQNYVNNSQSQNNSKVQKVMDSVLSIHELGLDDLTKRIQQTELVSPVVARRYIKEARKTGIIREMAPGHYVKASMETESKIILPTKTLVPLSTEGEELPF